jgi:hypothetical protein
LFSRTLSLCCLEKAIVITAMHPVLAFLTFALLTLSVSTHSVPRNVQAFSHRVRSDRRLCTGAKRLATGFFASEDGPPRFSYCLEPTANVIYLNGPHTALADMDIDCDGDQHFRGDGRCGSSTDTQAQTSFQDEVSKFGIPDLNANIHSYVVFGNEGNYTPTFDPREFGVKPLSVMAVVCGDQLVSVRRVEEKKKKSSPPVPSASRFDLHDPLYTNHPAPLALSSTASGAIPMVMMALH